MISDKKCKLYHDSGILTTKMILFQKKLLLLEEAKIKLDIDDLIKVRNTYPNNPVIEY